MVLSILQELLTLFASSSGGLVLAWTLPRRWYRSLHSGVCLAGILRLGVGE
jgi:hypothetical protein